MFGVNQVDHKLQAGLVTSTRPSVHTRIIGRFGRGVKSHSPIVIAITIGEVREYRPFRKPSQ